MKPTKTQKQYLQVAHSALVLFRETGRAEHLDRVLRVILQVRDLQVLRMSKNGDPHHEGVRNNSPLEQTPRNNGETNRVTLEVDLPRIELFMGGSFNGSYQGGYEDLADNELQKVVTRQRLEVQMLKTKIRALESCIRSTPKQKHL